jgi:hypothetical protein
MEAKGDTLEVLNRYQRLIMEHEKAYNAQYLNEPADQKADSDEAAALNSSLGERDPELKHTYRHGDGSAEIVDVKLLNNAGESVDLIDTGIALVVRVRVRFDKTIENPVFGFLIRNRHAVHAYGANTEQKEMPLEVARAGEVVEVTFSFDCWLGTDLYSLSVAVHSVAGKSYDWLDGVHFFRVASATPLEGIANLNATASVQTLGRIAIAKSVETANEAVKN